MIKHYSILHISDLHKPENCNFGNLFYSLQADCEVYTNDGIAKPVIIVVSGDVAEGTKNDSPDAVAIIRNQYAEARKFLEDLTHYFLDGDKRRMIIVPGNHDYCYKVSKESMELSPEEMAKDDLQRLKTADPTVRWNWEDKRFYHITNGALYKNRFELFREFYNDFYAGIRELPEDIDRNSYIVELDEYQTAFVCFNSCHRLDHMNPMGCICPDAITKIHGKLVRLKKKGLPIIWSMASSCFGTACRE